MASRDRFSFLRRGVLKRFLVSSSPEIAEFKFGFNDNGARGLRR